MWRDGGDGEIYAYLPESKQRSNLCDNKVNICNPDYGYSLGRNTFKFTTGKWISVRQVIKMNTAGKQDGKLALYVNGKNVINLSRIVYRTKSSGRVVGISKCRSRILAKRCLFIFTLVSVSHFLWWLGQLLEDTQDTIQLL